MKTSSNEVVIYLSDFDPTGSGYMHIGTRICSELVNRYGLNIIAGGLHYRGQEHDWPFPIVPFGSFQQIPNQMNQIHRSTPISAIIVALDIPHQKAVLGLAEGKVPIISLFPVESPPLCMDWAGSLAVANKRLVMSKFGHNALKVNGVDSTFISIGVNDPELWQPGTEDEKAEIRKGLGIDDDTFVILTVADNQERKNLSASSAMISKFSVIVTDRDNAGYALQTTEIRKTKWILVTRVNSPAGWDLNDLAMRDGIIDRTAWIERGVSNETLRSFFVASDCFLLTSASEGLGVPVLEAMSMRLPVIGTNACAIAEHFDGTKRGFPVEIEYEYSYPYGNGQRYLVSVEDGIRQLEKVQCGVNPNLLDRAQKYVNNRTWKEASEIVYNTLQEVMNDKAQETEAQAFQQQLQPTPA